MTSRNAGFTLIELMIAIVLLAILMMVAAPSLQDLTMNARITSNANDLMTDLAMARSEAVRGNTRAAICSSNNGTSCTASAWEQGWLVFTDADGNGAINGTDAIVKVMGALELGNILASAGHSTNGAGGSFVPFRPSGSVTPGGAGTVDFTLCDSRTTANVGAAAATNKGRRIRISATGRAIVERITCP